MAKKRREFICQKCGAVQAGWMGKCPDCGAWDSLMEQAILPEDPHVPGAIGAYGSLAGEGMTSERAGPSSGSGFAAGAIPISAPVAISELIDSEVPRLESGLNEFDRILGGGVVPGSAVLLGGDPGIGKSTLLLQAADRLAAAGHDVLYVTSEESVRQTQLRARRLGVRSPKLAVFSATNLDLIANQIVKSRPAIVVIDSIQMVYKPTLPSAPGTVSQLRQCGLELVYLAKATGCSVIFIGHVTKTGTIAGPRLLEHIVDTVLYFEGDRHQTYRMIRAVKNRFGSTNEIGLFRMTDGGLDEVTNPSEMFLANAFEQAPGSVITAAAEGSRVILVEVQALTTLAGFGAPKRKVSGADANRVAMIIAVLEKRAELHLADQDVFVNVVGGVKVVEPSADLAIALAIAGAYCNSVAPPRTIAIGEVGLGGELRSIGQFDARLAEAEKLGFEHAILPAATAEATKTKLTVHPCKRLEQAIECLTRKGK
ncbi:MAG: DNA repair protein RadA [Phycisphaerae bacterium]|nr:DNA repair protein RadA [Phycisphaerae bacterium]